ncbi:MAG: hypothetical protein QUS14_07660 [Pyrinomonadaceae bacterium]|nr:hypothetical protein [Pyrinomonadaceae bacterium]
MNIPTTLLAAAFIFPTLPLWANAQQPTPEPPSLREIEERARIGAVPPGERRIKRPTKAELRRVRAETAVIAAIEMQYRPVLDRYPKHEVGITRIFPDFDCEVKSVIEVGGGCANHVVGLSKLYFRRNAVVPDIHYNRGILVGDGVLSHNLIVELGVRDIFRDHLASDEMRALMSYRPETEFAIAKLQFRTIKEGYSISGIEVRDRIEPVEGRSYAIRAIAYRSKIFDRIFRSTFDYRDPTTAKLLSARTDNRVDVIVMFTIVDIADDGSIHLLWRRVSRQSSPTLRIEKNEKDPLFN